MLEDTLYYKIINNKTFKINEYLEDFVCYNLFNYFSYEVMKTIHLLALEYPGITFYQF